MSERKRVASPQCPEVDETEPYDWRSYGAGVSFGRKQALQEIRDQGHVIVGCESVAAAIELIQEHWAGYGDESDVGRQAYDDLREARDRDA